MKISFLKHLTIILLVWAGLISAPRAEVSILNILQNLEPAIIKSMEAKKIPGLAVAIIYQGQIVYEKGFGVREVGKPAPIDQNTVFQLGSVSKAVSATLAAILKYRGLINLDQPIDTGFGLQPDTTLRHVLSHTTGLPAGGFNQLLEQGVMPIDIQKKFQGLIYIGKPGEAYCYHNVVYNLMISIIELQTGQSFGSLIKTYLFSPLGMTRTVTTIDGFLAEENRVSAHEFVGPKPKKIKADAKSKKKVKVKEKKQKVSAKKKANKSKHLPLLLSGIRHAVKVPSRKEYANYPAAGGISASLHDTALFLNAVMGGRPDVLPPQVMQEFITPVIHSPDQWARTHKFRKQITEASYGLGWRCITFEGYPVVFHGGMIRGATSIIAFLPQQNIGIVILQNAVTNVPFRLAMQVFDWALGASDYDWLS